MDISRWTKAEDLLIQAVPMDRAIRICGKRLAALRKRRYMTQAEFSSALGIGTSRVAQIEAEEEVGIYSKNFRKLATALGMTTDQLMAEVGVGADVVMVPLPRDVYDSIAARAAHEGYPDVPAWLAVVATTKVFVDIKRDPPGGRIVSSPVPANEDRDGTPEPARRPRRHRQGTKTA